MDTYWQLQLHAVHGVDLQKTGLFHFRPVYIVDVQVEKCINGVGQFADGQRSYRYTKADDSAGVIGYASCPDYCRCMSSHIGLVQNHYSFVYE